MTALALNQIHFRISISSLLIAAFKRVDLWLQKAHQRRKLAEIDPHLRQDLGLSPEQVRREADKPFWR